jgi:hypothetical protein
MSKTNSVHCKIRSVKDSLKCFFCGGNHICRNCPLETSMAPFLRKKAGNMMEYYIAKNINCPECGIKNKLHVMGDHTPSLDIICLNCNNNFEVKSKCLSTSNLPNDIILPHGSYNDCIKRINHNLGLIVIIYGVDRIKKIIKIREVLYGTNEELIKSSNINIVKRPNSNLSTIFIKNKKELQKLKLLTLNNEITFEDDVNEFLNNKKN